MFLRVTRVRVTVTNMADTLTIRLNDSDREVLERAAHDRGIGLSGLVRALAEAEATRLRRERIRAAGESIVSYLRESADAREEIDANGVPQSDLP